MKHQNKQQFAMEEQTFYQELETRVPKPPGVEFPPFKFETLWQTLMWVTTNQQQLTKKQHRNTLNST